MTLYKVAQEFLEVYNNLEVDEETGEILNLEELDKVEMAFEDKAEAVALMVKNLEADAESLKAAKMTFAKRQKTAENDAARLKDYLDNMMKAVGKDKLERTMVKLSYRKSVSAKINPEEIGREWLKELDPTKEENYRKSDITKALKSGMVIPGAELEEKQNLQIK